MPLDDKQKKILYGAAVVGAAAVAYALLKGKGSKSGSDDVVWQAPAAQPTQKAAVVEKKAKKAASDNKEVEGAKGNEVADVPAEVSAEVQEDGAAPSGFWPELGVTLGELGEWSIALDENTGETVLNVNNSAIVRFNHAQFSPMFGDNPMANLLVEDQVKENYSSTKQCSEAQFERSMNGELPEGMPPQMAEMLRPRIHKKEAINVGPFDYVFEYDQQGPGMSLRSRQLQKLKDGVLYTLQVAGPPQVMVMLEEPTNQLAETITLLERPKKIPSKQIYTSAKAKAKVSVPFHWVSGRAPTKLAEGIEGLISWDTNAENVARRDDIKVYFSSEASGEALAKAVHAELSAKTEVREVNGVWTFKTNQGTKQSQVYVKDAIVVQVIAARDEITTAPESDIVEVMGSIAPAEGEDELRAFSPHLQLSFKAAMGSTLSESNWADPTIYYHVSREEGAPSLIIALPTPDPNKPQPTSIEGWYDNVEEEFPQTDQSRVEDKQYENIAGQKAVAFCTREMQPVAGYGMFTGASEEHKAKMYILYNEINKRPYLLRYATVTGEFRRLENSLRPIIHSMKFVEQE